MGSSDRNKTVKFILNASSEADLEKVVANNGRFELRVSDFKTLMGREWLNDVVINAYMDLICQYYSTKSRCISSCARDILIFFHY